MNSLFTSRRGARIRFPTYSIILNTHTMQRQPQPNFLTPLSWVRVDTSQSRQIFREPRCSCDQTFRAKLVRNSRLATGGHHQKGHVAQLAAHKAHGGRISIQREALVRLLVATPKYRFKGDKYSKDKPAQAIIVDGQRALPPKEADSTPQLDISCEE